MKEGVALAELTVNFYKSLGCNEENERMCGSHLLMLLFRENSEVRTIDFFSTFMVINTDMLSIINDNLL